MSRRGKTIPRRGKQASCRGKNLQAMSEGELSWLNLLEREEAALEEVQRQGSVMSFQFQDPAEMAIFSVGFRHFDTPLERLQQQTFEILTELDVIKNTPSSILKALIKEIFEQSDDQGPNCAAEAFGVFHTAGIMLLLAPQNLQALDKISEYGPLGFLIAALSSVVGHMKLHDILQKPETNIFSKKNTSFLVDRLPYLVSNSTILSFDSHLRTLKATRDLKTYLSGSHAETRRYKLFCALLFACRMSLFCFDLDVACEWMSKRILDPRVLQLLQEKKTKHPSSENIKEDYLSKIPAEKALDFMTLVVQPVWREISRFCIPLHVFHIQAGNVRKYYHLLKNGKNHEAEKFFNKRKNQTLNCSNFRRHLDVKSFKKVRG